MNNSPVDIVYFYPQGHEKHFEIGHPERPDRVEAIKDELRANGLWEAFPKVPPTEIPEPVLFNIHTEAYIEHMQAAHDKRRPRGMVELDTFLTSESWRLALNAAGGALSVASQVWNGEARAGFSLSRPPGHHATPHNAMGFCLLNNIALAAEYLLQVHQAGKLAIIDIDLHHGNGTQDIFWQRNDVFFISVHQLPLYPMTGYINQTGAGAGENATLNIPFPPNSGDQARQTALENIILPVLDRIKPEMLLISAGFDAHWKDPLGSQLASARGCGQLVSGLRNWADQNCMGKIMLSLEGGYDLEGTAASALSATQALLGLDISDRLGPSPTPEKDHWQETIKEVTSIWGL